MNIWPWSTIRQLRDALADAKREATLWETSYERRAQAYDEVVMQRMNLMGQLAAANQEAQNLRDQVIEEDVRYRELLKHSCDIDYEKVMLRRQLAEAQRNDTRDPKTGRFVKAER